MGNKLIDVEKHYEGDKVMLETFTKFDAILNSKGDTPEMNDLFELFHEHIEGEEMIVLMKNLPAEEPTEASKNIEKFFPNEPLTLFKEKEPHLKEVYDFENISEGVRINIAKMYEGINEV